MEKGLESSEGSWLYKSFLGSFLGHSIFVLLNIIIVLTGIFVPRYVNKPDLSIENVAAIIDEAEGELTDSDLNSISNIYRRGYFNNFLEDDCFKKILAGFFPSLCSASNLKYLRVAGRQLENDVDKKNKEIEFYSSVISEIDDSKKLDLLRGASSNYISSTIVRSLMLDSFARPELEGMYFNTVSNFFLASAEDDLEELKGFLEVVVDLEGKIGSLSEGDVRRSGDVIFEVILSNRGYADTVLGPSALLEINGETLPLLALRPAFQKISLTKNFEQKAYSIIDAQSVLRILYRVDESSISQKGRTVLNRSIQKMSNDKFKFGVVTESGFLMYEDNLPIVSISIESLIY